ncbi:MAG: DNA polymerase [Crinalium sp.]
MALSLLKIQLDKSQRLSNFSQTTLTPRQLQYAAVDAAILLDLLPILTRRLKAARLMNIAEIEFEAVSAVAGMELNGMLLDAAKMSILNQELYAKKQIYLNELKVLNPGRRIQLSFFPETADTVNLDSPSQVLKAFKHLGIPVTSTGKKVLIPLQNEYPIIKSLLEYRKYSKLISTYVQGLPTHINPTTGRIHPSYLQCGTRSGRFACRNPNLQNIPRDKAIRSCFIAQPGYTIIRADYSQIELRIVAKISGESRMIEAYKNGEDLHTLTASLITGKPICEITAEDRRLAKAINFGLIYGMGQSKLKVYAETEYGVIMTLQEATKFRKRFFQAYPGLKRWHEHIKETVYETSKQAIRTMRGRRRRWSTNPPLSELFNHPVQGSNADFLKMALGKLYIPLAEIGALLIGVVHDEIILECPNDFVFRASEILKHYMIEPAAIALHPIPVEVEVKVGATWAG